MVDPMGYLEFNFMVESSFAVLTDSGGVTEEATIMNVPCMTLRENAERPETIKYGTNELLGNDPKSLEVAFQKLWNGEWKTGKVPPLWDGYLCKKNS